MKEATLYDKLEDKKVHCRVCAQDCTISPGKRGYCQTRLNKDGKLFSLIYAKCSSIAADPIEKKPVFHYRPGSNVLSFGSLGCNLRCGHCQNWQIAHLNPDEEASGLTDVSPEEAIRLAGTYNCQGIAWTYNEPTIWLEYTLDTAKLCKQNSLYTVYVTNGYTTLESLDLMGPYLDVYRVDIKGFNNNAYRTLCKVSDYSPILKAAERARKKWNMHVEVVTNVIPTLNDDQEQLEQLAQWIKSTLGVDTPWHVTRFVPSYNFTHLPATPVKTLEKAREIGLSAGLRFVYIGNVAGHSGENTYCYRCGKQVISRSGYVIKNYEVNGGTCAFCGAPLNIVDNRMPVC
jgi:pyruvate formate lyase activating enzyme